MANEKSPLAKLADLTLNDEPTIPTAEKADDSFPLNKLLVELQLMVWDEVVHSPGIHFVRVTHEYVKDKHRAPDNPGVVRPGYDVVEPDHPYGSAYIRALGLARSDDMYHYDEKSWEFQPLYNLSASVRTHRLRHTTTKQARRVIDALINNSADPTSKDHLAGWRVEPNATVVSPSGKSWAKYQASHNFPIPQVPVLLMNVKSDIVCIGPRIISQYDPGYGTPEVWDPDFHIGFTQERREDILKWGYRDWLYCYKYPQLHDIRQLAVLDIRGERDYRDKVHWAPVNFPFLEVVWLINFNILPHTDGVPWETARHHWKPPHGAKTFEGDGCLFVEVRREDLDRWIREPAEDVVKRAEGINEYKITPRKAMEKVLKLNLPDQSLPPNFHPDFWLDAKFPAGESSGPGSPDPCKVEFKVLAYLPISEERFRPDKEIYRSPPNFSPVRP